MIFLNFIKMHLNVKQPYYEKTEVHFKKLSFWSTCPSCLCFIRLYRSRKLINRKVHSEQEDDVVIERVSEGKPHKGKVLAVIQPHNDDIPIFAGGTVAKLIHEGYTGYLIRTTNDEAAGRGEKVQVKGIPNNEKDNEALVQVFGLEKAYDLGNDRNHRMDENNIQEIKGRLIFLFRLLKVDTVICYDPMGAI